MAAGVDDGQPAAADRVVHPYGDLVRPCRRVPGHGQGDLVHDDLVASPARGRGSPPGGDIVDLSVRVTVGADQMDKDGIVDVRGTAGLPVEGQGQTVSRRGLGARQVVSEQVDGAAQRQVEGVGDLCRQFKEPLARQYLDGGQVFVLCPQRTAIGCEDVEPKAVLAGRQ